MNTGRRNIKPFGNLLLFIRICGGGYQAAFFVNLCDMTAIVRAVPRIERLPIHRCGDVSVPVRCWVDLDDEERTYYGGIVNQIAKDHLASIGKGFTPGKACRKWLKLEHGIKCEPKDSGSGLMYDILFQLGYPGETQGVG